MSDKIRWGIIGSGRISNAFAGGLKSLPDAEIVAIGSRAQATADRFGDKFEIPHRHDSYEKLAADPEVDVVYIGTPHVFHKENSMLCLNHGKHVLCEKAFTINAREARELVQFARSKKLFLMEAMWNRFNPAVIKARQMIEDGVIGDILMMVADLGFRPEFDPWSRLFAPELGGGALLDVGVYPISFASMMLGKPDRIGSMASMGQTGVDDLAAVIFGYEGGQMALLYCSMKIETPKEVVLMGSAGRLKVNAPIHRPGSLTLELKDREAETIKVPYEGNAYQYEAEEVMRCVRRGKLESDIMPLDESILIMETMDEIRDQWGLKYPTE